MTIEQKWILSGYGTLFIILILPVISFYFFKIKIIIKIVIIGMFQITLKKYFTLCATPFGVDDCV